VVLAASVVNFDQTTCWFGWVDSNNDVRIDIKVCLAETDLEVVDSLIPRPSIVSKCTKFLCDGTRKSDDDCGAHCQNVLSSSVISTIFFEKI
jgi:hypothetical protein